MPLKNNYFTLSDGDVKYLQSSFPGIDIAAEMKNMQDWLWANPAKSHKKRWRAFAMNWLKKCKPPTKSYEERMNDLYKKTLKSVEGLPRADPKDIERIFTRLSNKMTPKY